MLRSARPGDFMSTASGTLFELALAGGGFLTRHRGLTGGALAFAIAYSFVSANAVWYQPHRHPAPIFSSWLQEPEGTTGPQSRVIVEIPDGGSAVPDSRVALVQSALSDIELYTGSIDGVAGPRTRVAIETYQRQLGLEPSGVIDDELLELLGDAPRALPLPKPAPRKAVAAAPA
ncbi:MAG: peptidoglycan-binding domain-containing protein, partial [Rhizobiaceae bacterium]